jgi:hypothetical protein
LTVISIGDSVRMSRSLSSGGAKLVI